MNYYIKHFSDSILSPNRYLKQTIAVLCDLVLCVLSTWLAFFLRLEELIFLKNFNLYPALISVIIALPIFWLFGLYRTIFSYRNFSIIFTISKSLFVYGILFFLVIGIYGISGVPRSIGVLQPIVLFFAIISSRLAIKFILINNFIFKKSIKKKNVLVYGAGEAGTQLVVALENSPEFKVVGFLDDNDQLNGKVLVNKKIYSLLKLEQLIKSKDVNLIFLAMPTIGRSKRNEIIEKLNKHELIVKTLPSISEIVGGRITISDIKDLNINDLLNRDEVQPDVKLLNKNVHSKTVLVTGAGGSIGSELCRQIIKLKPSKLLLFELNEFALYKIIHSHTIHYL
jgi:FlaA1/EpsC-like NDP-sugar epimerase